MSAIPTIDTTPNLLRLEVLIQEDVKFTPKYIKVGGWVGVGWGWVRIIIKGTIYSVGV